MSVKWTENPDFFDNLSEKIAERLNAVGEFLSDKLTDNLSRDYFEDRIPSAPGEYPKMRTQTLMNSVIPHGFDRNDMEITVGPGEWVPYVEELVTMDRKFAYETLEENIDDVVRIFAVGE